MHLTSRKLTSILLILGPILMVTGVLILSIIVGISDWSDSQAAISSLVANLGLSKIGMFVMSLGMVMAGAGLGGVNASMAGGTGAQYARIGLFFLVVGLAVGLGESALTIGAGQAASIGKVTISDALYAAAPSFGSFGMFFVMLGFSIFGLGILIQKNFNQIVAGVVIVVGIVGAVMSVINYQSDWIMIPYAGFMLVVICLGVSFIKDRQ